MRNAPFAAAQEALAAHFLPVDRIALPVNAMLVNTGSRLVLIDTGTAGQMDKAAGALLTNLAAAGVAPEGIRLPQGSAQRQHRLLGTNG